MASVMVRAATIFAAVDANQDGTLSKDEFVATSPQYLDHDAEKLGKAFDAMDANGGGFG